jgi:folate-binding protein YgfZ
MRAPHANLVHRTSIRHAMQHVVLPEVDCLLIEGPDARRFAQAQFSGDVESLAQGQWQWNAWLDPQGRVQALMHLADLGDGRLLAMLRGGNADAVRSGLAHYVFRAKVSMTVHLFSGYADARLPVGHVDTRTQDAIAFGYGDRSLRLRPGNAAVDSEAANAWRLVDIRAGWPTLPAGGAAFLPPALALESLGAVSLGKGCYPGQEIVARLHYRGGHKSRLYHVRGPRPLEAGSTVHSDGGDPIRVLAGAMADGKAEALVVASYHDFSIFNILGIKYDVVSRYDP